MTPIIIKTTDGTHPDITLAELNEIIERVSREAFDDGYRQGQRNNYTLWYPPVYNPPVIHWNELTTPFINPYEIACDTNSNTMKINFTGEVTQNDNA